MNSVQQAQRNNILFFFLAIFLSALLLGAGAFIGKEFLLGKADGQSHQTSACMQLLTSHGLRPQAEGDNLVASLQTTENIETYVARLGIVLPYCTEYEMTSFCAGSGCEVPGLSFTLSPRKK